MISEDRLQRALTFLATSDEQAAEMKADVARKEYLCKLARSREFLSAEGSVEARKATAEISDSVQLAEDMLATAIVEFEKLRCKRITETLVVEVWRSVSANKRVGNI